MTEPKRPGLDEAIEAAARELARHEPIAGGMWCYCQPTDEDGRGPSLAGSWESHLAASVVPIIAAAVRADERAKVEAIRAMHQPEPCDCQNCDGEGMCCPQCVGHWPCDTSLALTEVLGNG